MASDSAETLPQAVRRHLGNGLKILTERGVVALYGAAMMELAKIVDSPVGPFLAFRHILSDGPELVRAEGLSVAFGAVLRQISAECDPPLGRSRNPVNAVRDVVRYHHTYELTLPDGVVPSRRPVNDVDFALEVPFAFDPGPISKEPIAAVIHVFYPESLPAILTRLANIPGPVDLFLSTDSDAKKLEIETQIASWRKGSAEIRIFPNRGRDVAAKIVGFSDVYARYELFLHLHTKKSPHGGAPLARWGDYLLDNLLGSPEIVRSILCLFEDPRLGVVFPQHLFEIRGIINWGYNYDQARALMRRIGLPLDKNKVLEFPSGSMFWGRSAAIRPLLDVGLGFQDFPEEGAHVDGTLAHAVERCVLFIVESAGYEWLKVVQRKLYPLGGAILAAQDRSNLAAHRLKVFQPCLEEVDDLLPPFAQVVYETRPLHSYPSRVRQPRLNLIVPTVNAHQTFGGVATALQQFSQWAEILGADFDRRIIVTDAGIEAEAYARFGDYKPVPFSPSLDEESRVIVDASERTGGRLDLRADDVFIATAWWTAEFALSLGRDRQRYFGDDHPFIYLIQDDEPYFYGWSSKFALAEATYHHGDRTIAVINSEELHAAVCAKFAFRETFCLPYRMNETLDRLLAPRPRERLILVYGRPSVARNAFELICAGLQRWQQRDPIRASRWKVVFLGESFEPAHVYPVQNATVEGKVSLELYADYLSRASVGIALMISPHPSYPPLEMAEAGLATIANTLGDKDPRTRFPDIAALDNLTPESLAEEIERAVVRMEPHIGGIVERRRGRPMTMPKGKLADPALIAQSIRDIAR